MYAESPHDADPAASPEASPGVEAAIEPGEWADLLERWRLGIPEDGAEHAVTATVRSDDYMDAIILATRLPGLVAALRDFPDLHRRPSDELGLLLHRTHEVVLRLSALEEYLIRVWHERPADRGSYRAIAQHLNVSHGAVRDRYQRILTAGERGLSTDGAAHADQRHDP